MGMRRVVTGHDSNGQAVFASEQVEAITLDLLAQSEFFGCGERTARCVSPTTGRNLLATTVSRRSVGSASVSSPWRRTRCRCSRTSTSRLRSPIWRHSFPDSQRTWSPIIRACTPRPRWTSSTSCWGRCVLELDNGATRELKAGDTVVQNGTRHAWRNPYDEPCVMVVMIVGATHDHVAS